MDIRQREKAPRKDASEIKNPKQVERYTLRRMLTKDESRPQIISFLRDQSKQKGPWAEYYQFFQQNMSGDVETMTPEIRKYVEKMVKDINDKYAELMA